MKLIERMTPTWTYLNEKGLISELKYKRLIKKKKCEMILKGIWTNPETSRT